MADREIVPAARAINNNVPWHDFHACSIKKNDDIRYKWQKLYESNRNGIPFTGAENGAYIPASERVGTINKEKNALDAFARRLADNMPAQPPIGRREFVPTPRECRPPPIPRLPAINVDKFCDRNGIHSSLTVYPNNIRTIIDMRNNHEIIGRACPKKPVWRNSQTVIGLVNKLKQEGENQDGHYAVGVQRKYVCKRSG
jgi:hypothetical protein